MIDKIAWTALLFAFVGFGVFLFFSDDYNLNWAGKLGLGSVVLGIAGAVTLGLSIIWGFH